MMEKELIVSKPNPISFSVDLLDQNESVIGDAREIINSGFRDWLPLILQLGVLSAEDSQTKALNNILYNEEESWTLNHFLGVEDATEE